MLHAAAIVLSSRDQEYNKKDAADNSRVHCSVTFHCMTKTAVETNF